MRLRPRGGPPRRACRIRSAQHSAVACGLVVVVALGWARAAAHGLSCPGDLTGDGVVTINELIVAVNTALSGCAPDAACPGDTNGDGAVTITELIAGVNAALNGCPGEPPPIPSPTPAADACPYTLQDDTLAAGEACAFQGAFSSGAGCPEDLEVLLLGNGSRMLASLTTDPPVSFGAMPTSNTTADLVAYFIDGSTDGQSIAGVLTLSEDGRTLTVEPIPPPPFEIGGPGCAIERFVGRFVEVVAAGQ